MAQPVMLATNRELIKTALGQSFNEAHAKRNHALNILGRIAVVASIGILLLLVAVALRVSIGWRVMTPTLAVAFSSLLIGLAWTARRACESNERRFASAPAQHPGNVAVPAASATPATQTTDLAANNADRQSDS